MFASELSKPSSLCLGAFDAETGRLVGYLVISRYVDAWHVMNVAVSPDRRRRLVARRLDTENQRRGQPCAASRTGSFHMIKASSRLSV